MDVSVVTVVCCQIEVSATSWSRVQRSPTDCDASAVPQKKIWNQVDFDKKENKHKGDNAFAFLHLEHNSNRSAEFDTMNPQ